MMSPFQVFLFKSEEILRCCPVGVRKLTNGGIWYIIDGQPIDDSEMALPLVRILTER